MNIAIFGAAGAIGRVALPELLARGHHVRLVGRDRAKLEAMAGGRADIVTADLSYLAAARSAAEGMDAVLYAVGLPYHHSAQYPPLMRIAVDAARAAGVRQFLLISTLYPYGRAQTALVAETHPREPHTIKGRNRKAQAEIVLGAHDPAGMRTLVLVLPDFYGPTADLSYAKEIFDAAMTGRAANIIGPVDVPHEYIYVPDVAPVIGELFAPPDAFGSTYHVAGAGTITTRDFIAETERAAGTPIKTLVANKSLLRLLGLFNPLMRELVEMHYLFTDPVVLDDAKLRALLPGLPTTPYATGIRATLDTLRAQRMPAHV